MSHEHRRDGGACAAAAAVTRVRDRWPRRGQANALLANVVVSEQLCVRARQPVVMKCLYDRHALGMCGVVHRGRQQRQRVVHVHQRRSLGTDHASDRSIAEWIPDSRRGHRQAGRGPNHVIARFIAHNVVAVRLEQACFGFVDAVFATPLLIKVVADEDLHPRAPAATPHRDVY